MVNQFQQSFLPQKRYFAINIFKELLLIIQNIIIRNLFMQLKQLNHVIKKQNLFNL